MKGWLRVKEAPEYCGVSKRTIRNWMSYLLFLYQIFRWSRNFYKGIKEIIEFIK